MNGHAAGVTHIIVTRDSLKVSRKRLDKLSEQTTYTRLNIVAFDAVIYVLHDVSIPKMSSGWPTPRRPCAREQESWHKKGP